MTFRSNKEKVAYIPKKTCRFCVEKEAIDYKDVKSLQKFLSGYGKIEPRKRTGVCLRHQRKLSTAIKRARVLALLPYVLK